MKRFMILSLALCFVLWGIGTLAYADSPGHPEHPDHPDHPTTPNCAQALGKPDQTGQPPLCLNNAPGQPTCELTFDGETPSQVCCTWDTTNTANASKYSLEFEVSVDTSDPSDCAPDVTEEVSFGTADFGDGTTAALGALCIPWADFAADLTGAPVSATAKVKGLVTKGEERCRQKNPWSPMSASFDLGCVVPQP